MQKLNIFKNSQWMLAERGFNFLNSFFVIFILTNHLGAESFGVYAYVIGVVSLLSFFANFGLDSILVSEFVKKDDKASILLGSSLFLLGLAAIFSFLAIFCVGYFYIESPTVSNLVYVYALSVFVAPLHVFYLFFNARMDLVDLSIMRILALILIFAVKMIAYFSEWTIDSFVLIELFSVISMALVSLGLFVGKKIPIRFQVCWKTLKDLFFKGLPLMISSGAIIIYAKIDLILIEHFLGVRQVGVYSVATKITEIWYVIPMTVTSLLFPVMLKSKKLSAESYRAKIRLSTEIMILICIFFSMSVFFLLPSVLEASLSGDFRLTSDIVRILAWCGPFVGLGYINGRYMVAENLLYLTLRRNIYGMALNIVLNILLIPRYGLYGAAFSTLFSMMYTGFLCLPFSRKTLDIFMIQCEALSFFIKPRTFFANVKSLREL